MSNLIRRQDAIDLIEQFYAFESKSEQIALQIAMRDLPSAQPEPHWIPVTERLPEEDIEVIVSCTDDSGDSEFSYVTTGWHFKGIWVVDNERSFLVRAWMPLPKPYAEMRQDE